MLNPSSHSTFFSQHNSTADPTPTMFESYEPLTLPMSASSLKGRTRQQADRSTAASSFVLSREVIESLSPNRVSRPTVAPSADKMKSLETRISLVEHLSMDMFASSAFVSKHHHTPTTKASTTEDPSRESDSDKRELNQTSHTAPTVVLCKNWHSEHDSSKDKAPFRPPAPRRERSLASIISSILVDEELSAPLSPISTASGVPPPRNNDTRPWKNSVDRSSLKKPQRMRSSDGCPPMLPLLESKSDHAPRIPMRSRSGRRLTCN